MHVIGLTGGIGSGKSTVSALLAAKGAVIVDAGRDHHASCSSPGTPVFEAMVERFGPGIVAADGTLDRQAVADIVFNDPEALEDLNDIVHPAVGAETTARLVEQAETDDLVVSTSRCSWSRPASGTWRASIVVDVDPEVAVGGWSSTRGMQEDDARARMARQATREERLARADLVIDNSGTLEDLEARVDGPWPEIEAPRAGRRSLTAVLSGVVR